MVQRRLDEAVEAMHGELISGDGQIQWSGVCLDSRRVTGGELFFALAGAQTDGHRFVRAAADAGAVASVVERAPYPEVAGGLVRVEDTLMALHDLTRAIRAQVPRHLVGVTGSSGKTTTKEMLAAMLSARYRTAASPGNLNNLYGFPIALLGIPEDTEWMVAEMGMSTPDELRQVSLLGRPDVAVFTNVRPAHLESFGSVEAIAHAKAELLAGLADGGTVVANADDEQVRWIAGQHAGPVVWYGHGEAEVRATNVEIVAGGAGTRFTLEVGGESIEIELGLFGRYNVDNFLAAAACAHTLGVSLDEIATSMERYQAPPMRGIVKQVGDSILIDDSYNSNPDALGRALRSAAEMGGTRHWAVVGEMLELGPAGEELHREVGLEAGRLGFSPLVGVGELTRPLLEAAASAGSETHWFENVAAVTPFVARTLRTGDVVLVKGSRGVGLDELVNALLEGGRD